MSDTLKGILRGWLADSMGAPVDLATAATNLGIAGVGYAGHKSGLLKKPPELIDPANVPFSSDWHVKNSPLRETGTDEYNAGRMVSAISPAIVRAAATMPRQRHGQLNSVAPGVLGDEMTAWRKALKDVKGVAKDEHGEGIIAFRGMNQTDLPPTQARPDYAVFMSDNPHIASSYVREPVGRGGSAGAVFPHVLKDGSKFVDFPSQGADFKRAGFGMFDEWARKMGPKEILRAKDIYDPGPGNWNDPLKRSSYSGTTYAFRDGEVAEPLYQQKFNVPRDVVKSGWADEQSRILAENIRRYSDGLKQHAGDGAREYKLINPMGKEYSWEPYASGARGELERITAQQEALIKLLRQGR